MKRNEKRTNEEIRQELDLDNEDIERELIRDEVRSRRDNERTRPIEIEADREMQPYENEELERQGYTENGLENPPYKNDDQEPEEPGSGDGRRKWKIA